LAEAGARSGADDEVDGKTVSRHHHLTSSSGGGVVKTSTQSSLACDAAHALHVRLTIDSKFKAEVKKHQRRPPAMQVDAVFDLILISS